MPEIVPLEWTGESLRFLDQTKLPQEQAVTVARSYSDVVDAIRGMQVRGAPAVGISSAYALVLAAKAVNTQDMRRMFTYLSDVAKEVIKARPTAANIQWAIQRMLKAANPSRSVQELRQRLETEAVAIHREDVATNRRIGELGADLIPQNSTVLTHSNTGALATAGYGTALGVIRTAWEKGNKIRVLATETRPLLQGARLTAWELVQLGIPTDLIVDSAAGTLLSQGQVGCVIVGADRVAANGDIVNKVGTYLLAVVAHENNIPFHVAAPTSTLDLSLASGDGIPLEDGDPEEVTRWGNSTTTPKGVSVRNVVFDVTPHRYISSIITERGIVTAPYDQGLAKLVETEHQTAGAVPATEEVGVNEEAVG